MSTSTDTELSRTSYLLSQLLEEAQNPTSQDSGPIILHKKEFDGSKMTDIRVIIPSDNYRKEGTDGMKSSHYEPGHKVIQDLIAAGYQVVAVMIGRAFNYGETTKHAVNVILVNLET